MQYVNSQQRQVLQGWKQPIPVRVYALFGKDYLGLNLFIHLLLHTRNEDMQYEEWYEGKPYKLNKGQVLYGKLQYAKYLNCSPSGAHAVLMRLRNRYKLIDTTPSRNFTVVTIKNYDQVVGMWTANVQQQDGKKTQSGTNNSGKNKKTVESGVAPPQYEVELNELATICETIFEHKKGVFPDTAKNYVERRSTFSKEEIQSAFKNILNEPDLFKLTTNASQPLAWWLASDSRIEGMLHCHLNKSPSDS